MFVFATLGGRTTRIGASLISFMVKASTVREQLDQMTRSRRRRLEFEEVNEDQERQKLFDSFSDFK